MTNRFGEGVITIINKKYCNNCKAQFKPRSRTLTLEFRSAYSTILITAAIETTEDSFVL